MKNLRLRLINSYLANIELSYRNLNQKAGFSNKQMEYLNTASFQKSGI